MTDAGKVRTHNEDSVIIVSNKNNEFILAVADGMGGHKAGEIASNIAIEHIVQSFESMETIGKKEEGIDWLRKIVKEINEKIEYPLCIKAKSGAYPEDCGGTYGYEEYYPNNEGREEFDMNFINGELEGYKDFAKQLYERQMF